ncbi:MAG: lipopolysaccharide biosynthesis protein RfbH [Planctomycetaceae bacterium]|nr:lipopolysaccharide biosynthesis protein RfbH [Planctomycetaceae bacterium]
MTSEELRKNILHSVAEYCAETHGKMTPFKAGDRISYAGRVFDESEVCLLVESALDFWLTAGRFAETFERNLGAFLNVKHCSLVNSGSSANLLAFSALTSPSLGERRIQPGDEVITVAAGFPTTVAPIIQYGAVPVFVDVSIPSCNIDMEMPGDALSPKTKAIMLAHTLGNPFDLRRVKDFCDRNGLWLIEDNCDALGSRVLWNGDWRYTGTIGDLGTSSFYPPHHLTMGEGGAVYTNDSQLRTIVESFRDWGRDCVCPSGKDDTCKHRFSKQYGELPVGYDHKYVYSHFGYNLKATDMQAAIGVAQLRKLPEFVEARKRNWKRLRTELAPLEEFAILPEAAENSDPSWFGFLITLRGDAPFSRDQIVRYLESKNIQTRMLFAGNLLKHPCFDEMRRSGKGYRIAGKLTNTDRIMEKTFWIGVYPGLSKEMIDFVVETILEFIKKR